MDSTLSTPRINGLDRCWHKPLQEVSVTALGDIWELCQGGQIQSVRRVWRRESP